jgi:hypothetical protein
MNIAESISSILDGSSNALFTPEELKALSYQLQGSYDNKPVEVLSKDLFHRQTLTAVQEIQFFQAQSNDDTVTNVNNGQLPAGESFTVHELLLRFNPAPTAQPNDLIAQLELFRTSLFDAYITVGVQNKTPWLQIPGSRFLAGFSGYQNLAEAAANTPAVAVGEASTVDFRYTLSIPKVIGEKVNFTGKIKFKAALGGVLTANTTELVMILGGIDVRAR